MKLALPIVSPMVHMYHFQNAVFVGPLVFVDLDVLLSTAVVFCGSDFCGTQL